MMELEKIENGEKNVKLRLSVNIIALRRSLTFVFSSNKHQIKILNKKYSF